MAGFNQSGDVIRIGIITKVVSNAELKKFNLGHDCDYAYVDWFWIGDSRSGPTLLCIDLYDKTLL